MDMYEFDLSLIGQYCSPSSEAGVVVVNNLTNVAIKSRYTIQDTPTHTAIYMYMYM